MADRLARLVAWLRRVRVRSPFVLAPPPSAPAPASVASRLRVPDGTTEDVGPGEDVHLVERVRGKPIGVIYRGPNGAKAAAKISHILRNREPGRVEFSTNGEIRTVSDF